MKASEVLGLLLSLVSLTWMSSGQEPVLVECSRLNFRVIAKRALFYRDEFVGPDKLFLGTGCQAIRVRPDEIEFDYPVSLCGIETQVFHDRVVIQSWLTYTPRNQLISAELRLNCMVPSGGFGESVEQNKKLWLLKQGLFLIQYRFCVRCDYAHFRDNWLFNNQLLKAGPSYMQYCGL
ncbi:oocyte-secreted protein 3-like [Cynocephalus volans]|uniref:oocyte-secreted protein 3-like n=1 Tax=Cynocephalus volans TaxID=110931 RepID=UPI002FC9E6AD